jgi:peroxiredoxin family protein
VFKEDRMVEKENTGKPPKKVLIICSKGSLADVYPSLIMGNGALMEGLQAEVFFTFFGLDAIRKDTMNKVHMTAVGNPAMRLPGTTLPFPNIIGIVPGVSRMATWMMQRKIEKLDIPTTVEFLDMIKAGGGKLYGCKMAMDMFDLKKEDLRDDIDGVLTVGEFYSRAGEDTQIIFT